MTTAVKFPATEFRLFKLLVERANDQNGHSRIISRLDMSVMEKRVGKETMEAMWEKLKAQQAREKAKEPK